MSEHSELLLIISRGLQEKFKLSAQAIEDILSRAVVNTIAKEELIFKQGVKSPFLFFIVSGMAEVIKDGAKIAEVKPGDVIGEMSIIGKDKATATVKSLTEMKVFKILKDKFNVLLNKYPSLNREVVSEAINRKNEQNDIEFT